MAIKVNYNPAWLSWVASTTTCLRYHGMDVDEVDVAGHSGYAFRMVVARDVCPSGPTVFDWNELNQGITCLGRSVRTELGMYWGEADSDKAALDKARRDLLEFVRYETKEGNPVVIWGTYVPEFGVATGVEDDKYICSTFREMTGEEQHPLAHDELHDVGIVYGLSFPHALHSDQARADAEALRRAARLLNQPDLQGQYRTGRGAYDNWIEALLNYKINAFGNAYNASCWAEQKQFARDFLYRLAERMPAARGSLEEAAGLFGECNTHMQQFAELFAFPAGEAVEQEESRTEGVRLLELAQELEERAALAVAHAAREYEQASLAAQEEAAAD
ncbi:hypothetical protein KDL29_04995 [bacterium]|nr:hypothetical protein [bacterium]